MKTDWKDDIFEGEHRLYSITDAPDGSGKYIEDITPYTQRGDAFGGLQLQQIGEEINPYSGLQQHYAHRRRVDRKFSSL